VLNGKSPCITVGELTHHMTAAVVDRLATLSNEEIEEATEASAEAHGEVG